MTELNDDSLELDVTRMLDGELSESEQDELSRRLLRDPAAHRLRDATADIDALAGGALREAFGGGETTRLGAGLLDLAGPRRRARWLGAVVAAAAVLIVGGVYLAWSGLHGTGGSALPAGNGGAIANSGLGGGRAAADIIPAEAEQLIWHVWDTQSDSPPNGGADESVPLPSVPGPRDVQRQTERQLYGIYDEQKQTVYLLGVDHVRTSVRALGEDL